jgi:2-polyprenyl-6-methoxyphenol hydroxylase-like FAD-dependent oxidoreductase
MDPERIATERPGTRVAVAGAGPGGITAALALAQAGFHVRVFERADAVEARGGAIVLNAIGLYILRHLGISTDDLEPVSVSEFRRYDGRPRARWRTDDALIRRAGSSGWIAGMMRSDLYARMLDVVPEDMIVTDAKLGHYEEHDDAVTLHFADGSTYEADVLIGADGIGSVVREQLWGQSELRNLGINVWLGHAVLDGPPRTQMLMHHSDRHQFGFAPLRHHGQDCFEFWFVEALDERKPVPVDPIAHIRGNVAEFVYPVDDIVAATKPENLYRWVVKGRPPLRSWSRGRVTLLGDAAHPTSPYAGYGAGMAIEDGYFLGRLLADRDLSDRAAVAEGLRRYDAQRVEYCNRVTGFARSMGRVFHNAPWPARRLRDFMLDRTPIPRKLINRGYTDEAHELLEAILRADGVGSPAQ